MKQKTGRKLLSFLLTLAMVIGLFPGMSLTAYAADEVSENISLVASPSANLKTISGTHYSVSCGYMCANDSGMQVCKSGALTINARKGETITKVVLTYSWGNNKSSLSASPGTFDGNATISDINAQQVTISSSNTAGVKISAVTVYFEGSLSNPTVTLTGGANAKSSGGLLTQSYLPGAMDTVTYTALTGAAFPEFETFTQNGVTVERTSDTVVTISGTPTANTEITVPDAESSSKMVTWGSSIINDSGRNGLEYQIRRNNSYSDTANGITLTKSGSGNVGSDWYTYGSLELNFTTATGKFTSIEIETSQIYDGGNWTKDGNTLKWNGTPSNSVSLSGSGLYLEGVSSINFVIEMPTVSVTITPGSNMTKTTDSGDAEQTGLTGAMADVVYTAVDGYYFPTNYSVAEVSGIKVTRDSYTQITVSGTPTADAAIALTAPTAKTTPDAPTAAAATDCTTADNNDGKLTGVTNAMEYKKSDAANWTAGTGSDITGLVPGTYYVRLKATDTTTASDNQELTIAEYTIPTYQVTYKVVNGTWSDDTTTDKTETVQSGSKPASVPTGMKAASGYTGGAWDTNPAEATITGATTFTYTFTALPTYQVTYRVVNGTWSDDTTADKTETVQSGSKPASVPTGMKASQGFTGGAWDENPADATITGAKTFKYTFTAIPIYTVTVTNDGHGTGSAAPVSGAEGTEVTLNATPAEGYVFKEWQVVSGGVTVKDNKFTIGTANVEIKAVFEQAGDMEDEVIVEPGAPAVSGTNIDEVAAGVVTADEVAAGVKVWVDISPLAEAAVPAGDKALANQAMQGFGGTAGAWIDMSMFKQVTGQNKTAVHQTATAFRFSMKVPDSLKKAGRTFWLLRLHNDKADILATTTGDTLSGETNLFSTYLIAYKDAETPTPTPKPVPKTGDQDHPGLWIILMLIGIAGLTVIGTLKVSRKRK